MFIPVHMSEIPCIKLHNILNIVAVHPSNLIQSHQTFELLFNLTNHFPIPTKTWGGLYSHQSPSFRYFTHLIHILSYLAAITHAYLPTVAIFHIVTSLIPMPPAFLGKQTLGQATYPSILL